MLKLWAELGLVCLKYLDESGFDSCSCLNYTYAQTGKQKRVVQPRKRGRRLSILGLWQPQVSFDYGLVVGSFRSERYLKLIEWQASLAAKHLALTGQITVVVQDNASSHKSQLAQQHWNKWQQQGLFLFFLPPYSPQMNRIEDEWLHLKRDELSNRVFDDEYDLALAVIAGVEARGQSGKYAVQRFMFNHV